MNTPATFLTLVTMITPVWAYSPQPESLYEGMAQQLLATHDYADASSSDFSLEAFLDERFVNADLGIFDVFMAQKSLADKNNAEDFIKLAAALLDMQAQWLEWVGPAADNGLKQAQDDLETLQDWVDDWSVSDFASIAAGQAVDALEADEKVRAAVERFSDYMGKGTMLELGREEAVRESLVLVPNRAEFVEFICLGGWMYPHLQNVFWQPHIVNWTNTYIDQFKILALEYAQPQSSLASYKASFDMNYASKTGKEQQIVQLSTNSLLDNYYGDRIPPSLAGSLAVNMVVELFGECSTRADGDLRERRTAAVEIFVPGGNPSGGTLAKNDAASRWRADKGSDYFTRVLRASQKQGAKENRKSKNKLMHFELVDDSGSRQTDISGPYLGASAKDFDSTAPSFQGDQIEFLRAYRSCFMNWLKSKGAGKSKASQQSFASLLHGLAHNDDPRAIENLFEQHFEAPLSNEKVDKQSLEGQFLKWLSKQK